MGWGKETGAAKATAIRHMAARSLNCMITILIGDWEMSERAKGHLYSL